ncbi:MULTISPECIES: EAL domain-containing protein [Brevibacillus]|uniref:EAL domain-containing protein n=1 Tax=Brevibacillus brevis TaxID=1393 RepID=A0A2Z4MKC7_BREBE|nr:MULTISPECIES: EAL domain-containing protein [Brevibacillus]AWX56853.1 EAL domain-containing protein [Brevibacillus brevis]NRR20994.1 EAL domain-containing protein [Brevibacillus sp. MS2.2]
MESIAELFKKKEYYHAFQPICQLPEKSRIGYEVLLRSKAGIHPETLFSLAKENKMLPELDTHSLHYALLTFFHSSIEHKNELIFVNIFPSTIIEDTFPGFIQKIARSFRPFLNQIVLEINESIMEGECWSEPIFTRRIAELKKLGFLIALDDVGDGANIFSKIEDISPDYIKIDRFFSQELSSSLEKQKTIKLFVDFCKDAPQLILEGVEEEEDFACASLLGVAIGQGYLFGKPGSLPDE